MSEDVGTGRDLSAPEIAEPASSPNVGEPGEAGSGSAGVSEFDEDGGEKAVEPPIEKPTE